MALELEQKVIVSAAEFARCLSLMQSHTGTNGDFYVQVNYYFDSPEFALSSSHSMLRVRRKKNALYLQYKHKRKNVNGMLLCEEEEVALEHFPKAVDPSRYFSSAPSLRCVLLGDLVTCRRDFELPGAVVSLDENIYFGKTDFEIEIEGDADAIVRTAAFLNPQSISSDGNGKFSRFMKEYRNYHSSEKGDLI